MCVCACVSVCVCVCVCVCGGWVGGCVSGSYIFIFWPPRVVKLVGVCLSPLSLVMELAPQGSLAHHLDLCPLGLSHTMAHLALHQVR